MVFDPISGTLAIMLGDSRSSVNFLGGSHMPGLNTQGLAHFHGLWFQWRSNFKALMVLF